MPIRDPERKRAYKREYDREWRKRRRDRRMEANKHLVLNGRIRPAHHIEIIRWVEQGVPVAEQARRLGKTPRQITRLHYLLRQEGLIGPLVVTHPVRLCSIATCGRVHYAKGYCMSHYKKWTGLRTTV